LKGLKNSIRILFRKQVI